MAELTRLTKRGRVNRAVAFRARIVLACAGLPDTVTSARAPFSAHPRIWRRWVRGT
jgi:hypothetical protein